MTYPEYKTAAERHLETCLELVTVLEKYRQKEQNQGLTNNETKDKNKLLGDLYYLTGYIIECSYSCAIYHKINFPDYISVEELKPANWSTYGVTADVTFRKTKYGGSELTTFKIAVSNHQLSGRMDFFSTKMGYTPPIPLLDGNNISRPASDLFDNWNAEVRYVIDSSLILDYENVFDFFYLAVEVYEGLLRNSMLPV